MDDRKFGMHLLLFTGFLGSGKTSFIVPLAKAIAGANRRAAIIVNEIGEIGIDNQLMRQLDFNVWELLNGCICCTLSSDLVSTLQKLDADYTPDMVIVESSGAANPSNVLSALPYYHGRPLQSLTTVSILDPLRLQMLIEVLTPLITSQIQHADLVIVNKTDLASPDEVAFACRTVQEINPGVKLRCTHAQESLEPALVNELAPWLI
jgi:G3E family GTPase